MNIQGPPPQHLLPLCPFLSLDPQLCTHPLLRVMLWISCSPLAVSCIANLPRISLPKMHIGPQALFIQSRRCEASASLFPEC